MTNTVIASVVLPVPSSKTSSQSIRYIDLSAVDSESKTITMARSIDSLTAPSRARQPVHEGDVLVSTVRPNLNGVARITSDLDGAIASTGFCVLRPKSELLDSRYLFHWVRSPQFVAGMVRVATGASYPAVSDAVVKASSLPLPTLSEQIRIADILDQTDLLRARLTRADELADEMAKSVFDEMFGTESSWPSGTIFDLIDSANYGTSAKAGAAGQFPVLRMGNLDARGKLRLEDLKYLDLTEAEFAKYSVQRGDVLFNRTNSPDLVGKTAYFGLSEPMAFAGYLIRLRMKPSQSGVYLSAFLNSARSKKILRNMAKSIVGMANINAQEIQKMVIPLPPPEEQRLFEQRMMEISSRAEVVAKRKRLLDELFASLQRRAFEGTL